MKLLLLLSVLILCIIQIQCVPHSIARQAPDFLPTPAWVRSSYLATNGVNYDGFTPPGLLQDFYISDSPSVLAIDSTNKIIFLNITNSFYYLSPEFSCVGSPGYPTYTIYYPNTTRKWTSLDEINGYTQTVQVGKQLGDERYTTVSVHTLALPAKGSVVTIPIRRGLPYSQWQNVIVVPAVNKDKDAKDANYFQGNVQSYVGDQLTLQVTLSVGSGTFSLWDVYVSGDQIYTGPAFDLTSCLNPIFNTMTTDNAGRLKFWGTWETYNVLQLPVPAGVDQSVSDTFFDTIIPGPPPAEFLIPPPGCGTGPDFCKTNLMSPPFPAYFSFPGPAYVSPFLP